MKSSDRDYLAAVLRGRADRPIQRLPNFIPAAWATQHGSHSLPPLGRAGETTADLAGTFRLPTTLPVVKAQAGFMQDALPAFVLDSDAAKPSAMNGTPRNPDAEQLANAGSDEQLMVAFSQGSRDAFSELFSRYKQPLFGFFRRRVADPAQAEELTQETFLAVLRASSRYEPRARFRTYLYAIGFKILSTHRRKAAFRATFLGTAAGVREPALQNAIDVEVLLRQAVGKLERLDREIPARLSTLLLRGITDIPRS